MNYQKIHQLEINNRYQIQNKINSLLDKIDTLTSMKQRFDVRLAIKDYESEIANLTSELNSINKIDNKLKKYIC